MQKPQIFSNIDGTFKKIFPSLLVCILYKSGEQAFSDMFLTKLSFLETGLDPFWTPEYPLINQLLIDWPHILLNPSKYGFSKDVPSLLHKKTFNVFAHSFSSIMKAHIVTPQMVHCMLHALA